MKNELVFNSDKNIRLDIFMQQALDGLTRSYIKKMIDDGFILLNGKKVKAGTLLKAGNIITHDLPKMQELNVEAQDIPLDILYEDSDLLVINKQCGLVVHPCSTTKSGTLVNALLYAVKDLSGINGVLRPGIVHRLDKDTSGLMVVAKNDFAHKKLAGQLKDHTMHREYYALVNTIVKSDFAVEGYIGRNPKNRKQMALVDQKAGRYSKTEFKVLKTFFKGYSLLLCTLFTGRTHQIRAHLKSRHITIVGDLLYGNAGKIRAKGMLLHAFNISFVHPKTDEMMNFKTQMPQRFIDFINKIET